MSPSATTAGPGSTQTAPPDKQHTAMLSVLSNSGLILIKVIAGTLTRIAARFPDAMLAFDTYPRVTFADQHKLAAKRGIKVQVKGRQEPVRIYEVAPPEPDERER